MSELVLLAASFLAGSHGLETSQPLVNPSQPTVETAQSPKALNTSSLSWLKPMAIADVDQPEFSGRSRLIPAGYPRSSIQSPSRTRTLTPSGPAVPEMGTTPTRPAHRVITPALSDSLALQTPRPASNSQLYYQRVAALNAGRTYTRLPANSFYADWVNASGQPTYEQWITLLNHEARAMARGQGSNRLSILVGDSISQWYPTERLTGDRFWLNQGISGDTSAGVLRRLSAFAQTRPDAIHVMVGINDLRRGVTDSAVIANLHHITRQLRRQHPQAQIIVYSILPTRIPTIPGHRIRRINNALAAMSQHEGARFVDLQTHLADSDDNLHPDVTTDGLHLNPYGYAVWHWALQALAG